MVGRITLLVTGLALAAGCQSDRTMLSIVPPPSFEAPRVQPQQPKAVLPPVVHLHLEPAQPRKAPAISKSSSTADVPASWIPHSTVRPWQWIVIHHSATPTGGAAAFDKMHKAKGWDGLGYDFVIGNGTDTGNGQVEVGYRWVQQLHGAHTKTPDNRFNEHGIGICLVGNFEVDRPSSQQMQAVAKLVAHLMKTYHISADRILGHGQTKATECPGRNTNIAQITRMAAQLMADSQQEMPGAAPVAQTELMHDQPAQ